MLQSDASAVLYTYYVILASGTRAGRRTGGNYDVWAELWRFRAHKSLQRDVRWAKAHGLEQNLSTLMPVASLS